LLFLLVQTEHLGWIIDELSADYISHSMLRASHPVSLNVTSHDTAIDMIRCIRSHGVNVTEVYVDTVGDPATYQARLTDAFDGQVTFIVAKKADSLYKCVSAASIAAKVRRDKVIREWASHHEMTGDADFGSGYPSDERTKAWMTRHLQPVFGYPELVRFSWSTTKELLKSDGVPCRWLCEDEEDDAADTQQITQFFTATPKANGTAQSQGAARNKRRRTDYFHQRGLSLVHTLDL
jgi:ribonuclease H2 subunit A